MINNRDEDLGLSAQGEHQDVEGYLRGGFGGIFGPATKLRKKDCMSEDSMTCRKMNFRSRNQMRSPWTPCGSESTSESGCRTDNAMMSESRIRVGSKFSMTRSDSNPL